MVQGYCPSCGEEINFDFDFSGDTACPHCQEQLEVTAKRGTEIEVRRKRPYRPEEEISSEAQDELKAVEWRSLHESSIAAGSGAYIAAEFMSLRAVEGIARRITNEGNFADAIDALEQDYPTLSASISYLKEGRNKVAHPDKERSSRNEAKQTYNMAVRIIEEIFPED